MKHSDSIVCFLMIASIGGCLDLSPLHYVDPSSRKDAAVGSAPDAGSQDGGTGDAAMPSQIEECRMCLATGPCSAQSDSCNANPKCTAFATCMTDTVCWGTSLANINNVAACITECGSKAGLMSQVDPAGGLLVPVLLCAQDPAGCASSCTPNGVH